MSDAQDIDTLIDHFEETWRAKQRPDVSTFLDRAEEAERPPLLRELVRLDIEYRLRAGERARVEEYLGRFPPLHEDPTEILELISLEYRVRLDCAERVTISEYVGRFPALRETLPTQLGLLGHAPSEVPGYEIIEELGRGGMGVVYRARHLRLNRMVALKMILAGGHAGPVERDRLRSEAESIARLHHPAIVQIYEAGECDGLPFVSLELCTGGSLDRLLVAGPLSPSDAALLVDRVARGVQAAHEAKVVHRDLKPANVLIGADGLPKVTDFGLAKCLDGSVRTGTGTIMGTPSYMAPEQAEGRGNQADPSTDVYSLGAILYECLTGRPPFRAATAMDTLRQVIADEPVAPRQLNAAIPRDLETVCLKCLRKEPAKRYPSAAELADDLGRFARGEPIRARPAGRAERTFKWVRRNPAIALLTAASVVTAVTAIVFASIARDEAIRADGEAGEAKRLSGEEKLARTKAETNEWAMKAQLLRAENARHGLQLTFAMQSWWRHDIPNCELRLQQVPEPFQQTWEQRHVRSLCQRLHLRTLEGHVSSEGHGITDVVWTRNGESLVSSGVDGTIRIWHPETGVVRHVLKGHDGMVLGLALSDDDRRLASAGQDGTIRIWDMGSGVGVGKLTGHEGHVNALAWRPDGGKLVSGGRDQSVRIWDVDKGKLLRTLVGHTHNVAGVAWSPDGKQVGSAGWDRVVKIWNPETGAEVWAFGDHPDIVGSVNWSPDGKKVLSSSLHGSHAICNADTGKELRRMQGDLMSFGRSKWSRDGKWIAVIDGVAVAVWNAEKGIQVLSIAGAHPGSTRCVAWGPELNRLASGGGDAKVKIWDVTTRQDQQLFSVHAKPIMALAWCADGRRAAEVGDDSVRIWDVRTEKVLHSIGGVRVAAWSPEGKSLLTVGERLTLWDVDSWKERWSQSGSGITQVDWRGDGTEFVCGRGDGSLEVWDTDTGAVRRNLGKQDRPVSCVAWSPDGRWIVSGDERGTIRSVDAVSGEVAMNEPQPLAGRISSLAWKRDGSEFVSNGHNECTVWGVATWAPVATLRGHSKSVRGVSWSPDGNRIATCGADRLIKIWATDCFEEKLTLECTGVPCVRCVVSCVAWSPDSQSLLSGDEDGRVRVWDAKIGRD